MKKYYLILFLFLSFIGCKGGNMEVDLSELKNIPQEKWDKLVSKRIYFGHQSVGYNIINGVEDVIKEISDIKFNIIETRNPDKIDNSVFAHSQNGENKDPMSKIYDFKKNIEGGLGDKVDIAFFKFCYVDIKKDTDIKEVFQNYSEVMDTLISKYPDVNFIHVSVPVRVRPKGIKTTIRRLLGIVVPDEMDNLKRIEFNNMLHNKYGSNNKIFDLAKYESTDQNGKRLIFKTKGKKNMFLVPEYTHDGKHLDATGRKVIGRELLMYLSSII